jgi:hypothetical protein
LSLGRPPLPNALTSTLEPDVGLPVAHLLVLVYALAQLFELPACRGAGDPEARVLESHPGPIYQIMGLLLKHF